jgi:hypothetical protein
MESMRVEFLPKGLIPLLLKTLSACLYTSSNSPICRFLQKNRVMSKHSDSGAPSRRSTPVENGFRSGVECPLHAVRLHRNDRTCPRGPELFWRYRYVCRVVDRGGLKFEARSRICIPVEVATKLRKWDPDFSQRAALELD